MKKEINDLLIKMQNGQNCIGETSNLLLDLLNSNKSIKNNRTKYRIRKALFCKDGSFYIKWVVQYRSFGCWYDLSDYLITYKTAQLFLNEYLSRHL